MINRRRARSFIVAALLAVLFPTNGLRACSCMEPPEPPEALARSDAVFVATILSITAPPARPWGPDPSQMIVSGGDRLTCRARVSHGWKGPRDTVNVYTARDGAACGYYFEVGSQYLIYGQWQDSLYDTRSDGGSYRGRLLPRGVTTGSCSRTCEIANAIYDLHELGAPGWGDPSTLPDTSIESLKGHLQSVDDPLYWGAAKALLHLHQETDVLVAAMRRVIHSGNQGQQRQAVEMLYRIGPDASAALPDLMGLLGNERPSEEGQRCRSMSMVEMAVERIRGPIIAPQAKHVYDE